MLLLTCCMGIPGWSGMPGARPICIIGCPMPAAAACISDCISAAFR